MSRRTSSECFRIIIAILFQMCSPSPVPRVAMNPMSPGIVASFIVMICFLAGSGRGGASIPWRLPNGACADVSCGLKRWPGRDAIEPTVLGLQNDLESAEGRGRNSGHSVEDEEPSNSSQKGRLVALRCDRAQQPTTWRAHALFWRHEQRTIHAARGSGKGCPLRGQPGVLLARATGVLLARW
eukprot:scaffold48815_cov69-Phaeocystis_antarctica.AAC.5